LDCTRPTNDDLKQRAARLALAPAAVALCAILLNLAAAPVHAQVGNRNFIEPMIVQDPNPSNSLDLLPQWIRYAHGETYGLPFSLEKQLSKDFSIQVGSSWEDPACATGFECDGIVPERRGRVRSRNSRRRRHRKKEKSAKTKSVSDDVLSGFSDLEILTKYAFFASDEHETRLAIGSDTFLPSGNPTAGGETHTYMGPIFMFAKGFGDIPNQGFAKYLRPFAIQGDVEYLWKTGGTEQEDLIADGDLSYSLQYLNDYVTNLNLQRQVRNLVPFAEFTYEQIVEAHGPGTTPDVAVLPGVAYMTNAWQVSAATAFPLNRGTVQFDHAAAIFLLSLTLDQIFRAAGRTLF
jgi:hypothetical protein